MYNTSTKILIFTRFYITHTHRKCFFIYRQGTLIWHNGIIPNKEKWVKVGGDKGGNSFKMNFQIANLSHPNSLKNTVMFSCFEATDSMANIQKALPLIFEQLSGLKTLQWR